MKWLKTLILGVLLASSVSAIDYTNLFGKTEDYGNIRVYQDGPPVCRPTDTEERLCNSFFYVRNTGSPQNFNRNQINAVFRENTELSSVAASQAILATYEGLNRSCQVSALQAYNEALRAYTDAYSMAEQEEISREACKAAQNRNETLTTACEALLSTTTTYPDPLEPYDHATARETCTYTYQKPVYSSFTEIQDRLRLNRDEAVGIRFSWMWTPRQRNGVYVNDAFNITIGPYILDPEVDACLDIESTGYYELNASVKHSGGLACFHINASNVFFNCSGYNVEMTNFGSPGAFVVENGADNVTVEDCRVNGTASQFLEVLDASNVTFRNVTMLEVTFPAFEYALYVDGSTDVKLLNSYAEGIKIFLDDSIRTTINNTWFEGLLYGNVALINDTIVDRSTCNSTGNCFDDQGAEDLRTTVQNTALYGDGSSPYAGFTSNFEVEARNVSISNFYYGIQADQDSNYSGVYVVGGYRSIECASSNVFLEDLALWNASTTELYVGNGCDDLTVSGLSIYSLGKSNRSIQVENSADDNEIDCLGGVIQGAQYTGSFIDDRGINIKQTPTNQSFSNCVFSNQTYDAYLYQADGHTFQNLQSEGVSRFAYLEGTANTTWENITLTSSGSIQIELEDTPGFPAVPSTGNKFYDVTYTRSGIAASDVFLFETLNTGNAVYGFDVETASQAAEINAENSTVDCGGGVLNASASGGAIRAASADFNIRNCTLNAPQGLFVTSVTGGQAHHITIRGSTTDGAEISGQLGNYSHINITTAGGNGIELRPSADKNNFSNLEINGSAGLNCVLASALLFGQPDNNILNASTCYAGTRGLDFSHTRINTVNTLDNWTIIGSNSGIGVYFNAADQQLLLNSFLRNLSTGAYVGSAGASNTFRNNYFCQNTLDANDLDASTWTGNQCNTTSGAANCSSVPYACPTPTPSEDPLIVIAGILLLFYMWRKWKHTPHSFKKRQGT